MLDVIFENIADFIQRRLEEACEDIKIAVAWFTNEELFNSLLAALNRGVTVSIVILDDTINRNELALDYSKFIEAGGRLYFSRNRKMHNKFVIVDSKFVLTGSYNWTYYAENLNWENVLSTDDVEIVSKYAKEYNQICQTLKEEKVYVPIRFSELGNEQLYDNYAYLSNDLNLKSKHTKELIERINRENHRNVAIEKIAREQNFDYCGIPKLQKSSYAPQSGVARSCIDDSYFLDVFVKDYQERYKNKVTSIHIDFKINPKAFWFKWEQSKIVALLCGGFINHLDIEPDDLKSTNLSEDGEWFIIKYFYFLYSPYQQLREFVENLKTILKHNKTKGILTIWYKNDLIQYKTNLLSFGFKEEPLKHVWKGVLNKECGQYRLTL